MSFVLACAQEHDDGDQRRESGHGGRSLDWGRPIAPVAHRTERSAPDRKAAGSIPARRTKNTAGNELETKTTQRARVNGIEIGYQITGKGEPLVLLHGGFGSVEMFGSNVDLLAAKRQVIGVDLQSHGRSPAADRPMRFETMADDIAELIPSLGLEPAAIMGFSLGGAVALRTAIQHPDIVQRLVLVSTVFKRTGWYPEMRAGMDAMGPETADFLMQSPMYQAYQQLAPRVEDWPVLVQQLVEALKIDYDWSADIPGLSMPVMLV